MKRTSAIFVVALALAAALWLTASLSLADPGPGAGLPPARAQLATYSFTFQQGVSPEGYVGAADTWIDSSAPTVNHALSTELRVRGNGQVRSLLRFDLAQHIPVGATVISATLQLRVVARSSTSSIQMAAYAVLQPWVVAEATWNDASSGVPWWGGAGCEGSSRAATPAALVEVDQPFGGQVELDVTSAVQTWANDPLANQGLLLKGEQGGAAYWYASSDYLTAAARPKLIVTYEGEPPPPTMTNTLTPTATDTPTRTPTRTQTSTRTATPTATPSNTRTSTRTSTATATQTGTRTQTATPTETTTGTVTRTVTHTPTPTSTSTQTSTRTPTGTRTVTATPTQSATSTRTRTLTPVRTRTSTPTRTQTPIRTVTRTPTLSPFTVITSTLGDWKSYDLNDCLKVNEEMPYSRVSNMLFIYRGSPSSVKLHVTACNTDHPHPIYLNGVQVGTAPEFSTETCECNVPPLSGYAFSIDINPNLLVGAPSYANAISTTNILYPWDSFKIYHTYLTASGPITGTSRSYFTVGIDEDGALLQGGMQLPIGYDPAVPRPLLVVVPGTKEDKDDGLNAYAVRANDSGWLLASLDMRLVNSMSESFMRTPSLAVQHDIMGLVHHMQLNYAVDASRIYIAGFSTGGGIAATMAAKYPDVFAAVLDYAGPTDYAEWYYERPDLEAELARDFRGWPGDYFEYPRRSSRVLARNLQYVPMRIVHGTADDRVPYTQSSLLYNDAMPVFYDPPSTFKELHSHSGGHEDWVVGVSETDLQFLEQFTLVQNPQHLQIITDEAKGYYWLRVDKAGTVADAWQGWVELDATYDLDASTVWLTAKDGDYAEGKALAVTLDLTRMGLPDASTYDIWEYDDQTGESWFHPNVSPAEGQLVVSVPSNAFGVVNRRYVITFSGTVKPTPTRTRTPTLVTPSPGYTATPTTTPGQTATRTATLVLSPTPTNTAAPGRMVYVNLEPRTRAVARGDVFSMDIQIVAGSQLVDGAEVHLFFDQAYLQVVDAAGNPSSHIQDNGYLSQVIRNSVYTNTRPAQIFFAAGILDPAQPKPSGTFALAKVYFKALWGTGQSNTPLVFGLQLPDRTDVTFGGSSLLAGVGDGTVTISGDILPATPTPIWTPTQGVFLPLLLKAHS